MYLVVLLSLIIFLYKMAEFQELTKAINDNLACFLQTAKNMDQNNRMLIECTRQICREVGSIDFDQDSNKEKLTGVGHIRIFDRNPKQYEDWVKEIEKTAVLSNASDRKRQLLAPIFYGDLVYKSKRIVGKPNFSDKLKKIVKRYIRVGYNLDIMPQSSCLVLNPITVYSYGFLFNCTTVGQASDTMTALT